MQLSAHRAADFFPFSPLLTFHSERPALRRLGEGGFNPLRKGSSKRLSEAHAFVGSTSKNFASGV